jgi:hypothetical protein
VLAVSSMHVYYSTLFPSTTLFYLISRHKLTVIATNTEVLEHTNKRGTVAMAQLSEDLNYYKQKKVYMLNLF